MRARNTDPITSHGAASMVTQFADDHYSRILKALSIVRAFYGTGKAGAEQIADQAGLQAYQVRKRLPELAKQGEVRATNETRKTACGRSERLWGVV